MNLRNSCFSTINIYKGNTTELSDYISNVVFSLYLEIDFLESLLYFLVSCWTNSEIYGGKEENKPTEKRT